MRKIIILAAFLVVSAAASGQDKKVFAHYMLGIGTYDHNSVDGFKKEVIEAMDDGIDGFAIDFGGWDARYEKNMTNLVQAIDEVDKDFFFFFSIDKSTAMPDSITIDLVKKYYNNQKYFRYGGNFFLSAWGGRETAVEWKTNVLKPLRDMRYKIYFVPYFFPSNWHETPSYSDLEDNLESQWKGNLNGYFYFGAAGLPFTNAGDRSTINSGEAAAKVFHRAGLTFMASVTPLYYQTKHIRATPRYFDYDGSEGLIAEWKSIIDVQKPEWVELVTWNDWDESTYFSPMQNVPDYTQHVTHKEQNFYKSHAGFAQLNKYFIKWYKGGTQPPIKKDRLFFFYRTHPISASADDPEGKNLNIMGDQLDDIYVTALLTQPAELVVKIGSKKQVYHLKAGLSTNEVPFSVGTPVFTLSRNNAIILSKKGEDIKSNITRYNYNYYSGFAE